MQKDPQQTLFRQKSLERISSPEQLNDYIRVSTPSIWLLLTAVVVLLLGVCAWGVFGHMDTTLPVAVVSRDGAATAFVRESDAEKIAVDATVSIGESAGSVLSVSAEPVRVDDSFSEYMRHIGGLQAGEWVHAVELDIACEEGVHAAQIVIDSVSPISFVLN